MSDKQENALKLLVEMSKRTDRMHRRLFENHAVDTFGIHRSQHMTLMYISRHENASQKQIADEFKISAAAVAVTLKKLEAGGFIVRGIAKHDNRQNFINITEKGKRVVRETRRLFTAIDYAMFDGMSDEELEFLMVCSEKMYQNLVRAGEMTAEQLKEKFDETVV
ncbi:MAG: MarR family transcriptional regulator [Clostridia bacterium]|nr:MarR family transcriptional regulator [Clostridia bacterium]